MPPKTKHIVIHPDEMDEIDIMGYSASSRINADPRHGHGLISPHDVVLADIQTVHVPQESKPKRADIKTGCRVRSNLED
jgi:hypothetical protein